MNRPRPCLIVFLALAFPITGSACEPILPLAQLLSGSSAVGPAYFTHSLFWLLVAIGIKCVAFTRFEKRLSWTQAAQSMLCANIVSTIPGILIAGFTSSVWGIIFVLPVVFGMGWMVRDRIRRLTAAPGEAAVSGVLAALAFFLVFVASLFLYGYTQYFLFQRNYATYWPVKFLFVALVASTGIIISTVLEEGVIGRMSRKSGRDFSFYTSVIRANYVTLGAILLVAAITTLPERMRSPGFVIGWLDRIWTSFQLT